MSDIPVEGRSPEEVMTPQPSEGIHTHHQDKKSLGAQERSDMMKVIPTQHVQGNEMLALLKMLEGLNKNVAFLASTVHRYCFPDEAKKNG